MGQLEVAFRQRMADHTDKKNNLLWTQPEVYEFANQAEREACERAFLIEDSTTSAVCQIDGEADTATYNLHTKILEVRSVRWNGRLIDGISRDLLDQCYPRGWDDKIGNPRAFIDPAQRFLTLFPIPTIDAAIKLIAFRLPLNDMTAPGNTPEIHERHHFGLLDWMEHLAYLKQDTETLDPMASAKAEARFTARFGPRVDADTRRTQRARSANQIRMNPSW